MDPTVKEHYLEIIPIQVRDLVKNLDDDNTLAVYGALLEKNRMGFNELKELFHANPSQINRALKSLIAAGLVFRRAQNVMATDDNGRIYYELSELGQKFYDTTFDLVIPSMPTMPQDIPTSYRIVDVQRIMEIMVGTKVSPTISSPPQASAKRAIIEKQFQDYVRKETFHLSIFEELIKRRE